MAGDDQAKADFSSILTSIYRKFDLIHVKWTEQKFFEAKFRTEIQRNNEDFNALCDEWVDLFSNATSTVWVKKISNTGPKIRFRKQYQCWPQIGKEVQKELLFDARRCKGTLDVKVLTDNPLTRRKNKHIRMGLNIVVKINFTHLHRVDTTAPYSFFIHQCEPQLEPPKPIIQSNDKLSQKVAEMVQKGLNASPKVVNTSNILIQEEKTLQLPTQQPQQQQTHQKLQETHQHHQIIQDDQLEMLNIEQVTLNQVLPIQNGSDLKLPQLTQVVVSSPQLEMSEPLLMCQQTLMFDPSQVIPVTAHHFVQVHSNISNQQGHYL